VESGDGAGKGEEAGVSVVELAAGLIAAHAVGDYWMQSDALAKMKNRHGSHMWMYALTSHAIHHGLAVFVVTGSLAIGIGETISHWLIDFGKCENWYGIHADQAAHIACKAIWLWFAI
jgi:hypothetical protein